jgi:creatinine amidohydrolase/Fe(II)-dependent formamide hydrolase-like protein
VTNAPPVHTAFFFSTPGSVHRATQSGTWGDARESSAEFGERYLAVMAAATLRMLDDVARTYEAMPPR